MKVVVYGAGKLGLPLALVLEQNGGHDVHVYDIDPKVKTYLETRKVPYQEEGIQPYLDKTNIRMMETVDDAIFHADVVFCPIQTPHSAEYEGVTLIPDIRKDFDYSWLKAGVKDINDAAVKQKKQIVLVIVSTVLPGTIEREIKPVIDSKYVQLSYSPQFIAMGTTIHDFTHPEFVLLGVDSEYANRVVGELYRTIHDRPIYETTIGSAELTKVAYNTFITMKLCYVNTMMEICDKMNLDVDAVTNALKMATDRLISTRYLTAGQGDGGGCHNRDNIAFSWLSQQLNMGFDFFEAITYSREEHSKWMCREVEACSISENLPIVILGKAFKPETNLTVGSPSTLMKNILEGWGHKVEMYDHIVDGGSYQDYLNYVKNHEPAVYFIGTKHKDFEIVPAQSGSVVIDPHRYVNPNSYGKDGRDVELIYLGARGRVDQEKFH